MTPAATVRFWSRVQIGDPDDCWPWSGALDRDGYGQFKPVSRKSPKRAHRVAYELEIGDCDGTIVLHSCGNRACCNPAHLRAGTVAANHFDRIMDGHDCRDAAGRFMPVITV